MTLKLSLPPSQHKKQTVLLLVLPLLAAFHFFDATPINRFRIGDAAPEEKQVETTHWCESSCLSVYGKNGSWVQDWNFAEKYGQHPAPLIKPHGPYIARTHGSFKPSEDAPFPWRTSWKWTDSSPCQVDYTLDSESFCNVLEALKIETILFHGDSLSASMFDSLLNKFGPSSISNLTSPTIFIETAHLYCLSSQKYIPIRSIKGNGGQDYPHSPRNNYTFEDEANEFLNATDKRTLAIFNIGAHYHSIQHYQEDLVIWLDYLRKFPGQDNLYFFRVTSPGHVGCQPQRPKQFNWTRGNRIVPLKSYDEFISTSLYEWNLFEIYNVMARKAIQEWNTASTHPAIHLLDIYNMTALRRDGHPGKVDCLHYVKPGPVDWWNHLWFTYLKELATASNQHCRPRIPLSV